MNNIEENKLRLNEQYLLIQNQNESLNQKNTDLQKYIHSNIQLEQFAHIASHDLKSPLRTISSYTGLLKKKLTGKINDKEKEYFNFVEKGTKKMSALINDLLSYSKANSQELNLKEKDMNELLDQLSLELEFDINESRAIIEYENLPTSIFIDEIKIKQVFQNLISNSIKFISSTVEPRIVIESKKKDGFYEFSITDNGIGIERKYIDMIFKPFQRLHQDEIYEGTGMGLAICKKIIEQHQGQLSVDSHHSHGSKFIFTIPDLDN